MGGDRIAQRLQIVAAFEQRDDAAAGAGVGDVHQLFRRPGEVLFGEVEIGERVAVMRVEARGNDHELGSVFIEPRQDAVLESGLELVAVVARAQRRIDDGIVFAALADGAGAGKQRHLMRRAIHHRLVGPENLLRAVAVMHVEIDDRNARDAVMVLRMARGNGGIVEQAEPHRPRRLGVMAGRPGRDKGVGGLFG